MDTEPWSRFRARMYSFLYRAPKTNRLVVDRAGLVSGDRVLDIGCGPGAAVRMAAKRVPEGEAVGIDRSAPMIDIARRRSRRLGNVAFHVGPAESLPFPDGSFTVVLIAHSFHHWENRRQGLAEVHRVLEADGRGLILEQDGKDHGLTDGQAETVMNDMRALGFTAVTLEKVDKQVVISGVAGAAP